MATKIIIDSASDISSKEAKELGILMIPVEVNFEGKDYLDGENLSCSEFFEKLETCSSLPKTSQISPARYSDYFEKIVNDGDDAVVICLSSKLSGTYNSAKLAAENYNEKIQVVDSLNACIGERVLCFYAIELLKNGCNAKDIAIELEKVKGKVKVYAVLNTLKYLKKGGRISPLVAFAGELMGIKPVVGVIDGEVKLVSKAMGFKKGNKALVDFYSKTNGIDYTKPYVLGFSGNDQAYVNDFANEYEKTLLGNNKSFDKYYIGCTIGTHIGPGAIAIAYIEK